MQMLHGSIAEFIIVQAQKDSLYMRSENNPPDGFLDYRRGLHPPPEGPLLLRRRHLLLPDVVAIFLSIAAPADHATVISCDILSNLNI